MSLAKCIKKLKLDKHEEAIFRGSYREFMEDDFQAPRDAALSAIDERLKEVEEELADLVSQVRQQVPGLIKRHEREVQRAKEVLRDKEQVVAEGPPVEAGKEVQPPVVPEEVEAQAPKSETAAILEGIKAQAVATTKMAEAVARLADAKEKGKVRSIDDKPLAEKAETTPQTLLADESRVEAMQPLPKVAEQQEKEIGLPLPKQDVNEKKGVTPDEKGSDLSRKLAFAQQRLTGKKYAMPSSGMTPVEAWAQIEEGLGKKTAAALRGYTQIVNSIEDVGDPRGKFAIAWHGSPHKFVEFDSSRIGSGEGAQAYGHGLYFAESMIVADSYREILSERQDNASVIKLDGNEIDVDDIDRRLNKGDFDAEAIAFLSSEGNDVKKAEKYARALAYDGVSPDLHNAIADILGSGRLTIGRGHLYKVEIKDEVIERMLDWDRSLSQQSQYIKSSLLEKYGDDEKLRAFITLEYRGKPLNDPYYKNFSGGDLLNYMQVELDLGTREAVSEVLYNMGVPGVKYLDHNSRKGGIGTRNFVVFDDKEVTIIGRDGEKLTGKRKEAGIQALQDGLPEGAKLEKSLEVHGFYDPKTERITLFSTTLSKNNASTVSAISLAMHEGLHRGLAPILGKEQFDQLKTWITNLADAGDTGSSAKYAKEASQARRQAIDADTNADHVAEETLAYFVQDPANRQAPFLRRMWAKIKAWAVTRGIPLRLMTIDAPLLTELVVNAIRAKGGRIGVDAGVLHSQQPGTYYSALKRAFSQAKQDSMPGAMWAAWLDSNKGNLRVKDAEIHWTGIKDYLRLHGRDKVSRPEILSFLSENGVGVRVVQYRDSDAKVLRQAREDLDSGRISLADYDRIADGEMETVDKYGTRFKSANGKSFVPRGGVKGSYRELLLTLPNDTSRLIEEKDEFQRKAAIEPLTLDEQLRYAQVRRLLQDGGNDVYKSSHFPEPNILAHLRADEVMIDGKLHLRVIEIQSDWGQDVRRGKTKNAAPFVEKTEDWVSLAVKKAIHYAAQQGLAGVVFANGKQNADFYSLSRYVDSIEYQQRGSLFNVTGWDKKGRKVWGSPSASFMDVENALGQEMAQRLKAGEGRQEGGMTFLSGLDLAVGGEGMRAFYDEIVPNVVNTVIKPLGARLQPVKAAGAMNLAFSFTEAAREKALGGFPLFSKKKRMESPPTPGNVPIPSDIKYSKSPISARANVADRVDRLLRGQSRELPIYLGETPDVLVASGMKRLPMGMGEAAALTSALPKGERPKGHGLSVGDMTALIDAIADPIAVMQRVGKDEYEGTLVVVTDLIKGDGSPIVVAIQPRISMSGLGRNIEANRVATAFVKEASALRGAANAGKLVYLNDEKNQEAGLGFAPIASQSLPGQRRSPSALPQSGSRSVSSGSIVPPWVRRTILTPEVIDKRGDRKAKLTIDPWTRDIVFSKAVGSGRKMYREENAALKDRIQRFGSLPSVLRYISENGITDQSRARAKKLLDYDSVKGTRITVEDIENDDVGRYYVSRDAIKIAPFNLPGVPMEQVILHEAKHAVTIHELRRNPKVREKALALFFDVKNANWYKKARKGAIYGLENEEEFIAEVFSNPTFRQFLRETKPLWQRFMDIIRRLLRLTPNKARNYLAEADQLSEWIAMHQDAKGKLTGVGGVAAMKAESSPISGKPTKIGKAIDKGNEVLRAIPRIFQDSLRSWDTVQQTVIDAGGDITPEMDVKAALERYPTRTASFLQAFMRNQVKPLLERSQELGIDLRDIGLYLYSVHAPHRNEYVQGIRDDMPEAGSGMTNEEADKILKEFEARKDFKDFKELAEDFRDLNDAKLDLLVEGGVYTQEQADSMREALPLHVPLKGFEVVDEKGDSPGTGKGKSMSAKVDKSIAGRRSRAGMIIENIIHDYERAITLVEKAEVGKALTALIEANPDKELWTIGEPEQIDVVVNTKAGKKVVKRPAQYDPEKEIRVIRDGKVMRMQIHDELALRAYNQLYNADFGTVFKVLEWSNRILREFWTAKNPAFLLINPMRDMQTAFMRATGELGATFAAKSMKRLNWARKAMDAHESERKMSKEDKQWVNLYGEAGGHTGAAWIGDLDTTTEKLDRMLKRAEKNPGIWRSAWRSSIDWIEKHNVALENMTRLAAFREYMEQSAKGRNVFAFVQTIEGRRARNEAGRLARELTVNFNRKGEAAREMGAWWLFFNPGVQGAQNIWWAISQSPHKRQVWGILGGLVTIGFTLGMVAGDDDELIRESQEQRNFIYRSGETLYQWPIAYGLSWFVDLGRLLARTVKGGDVSDAASDIAMSFISNFTAFGDIGRAEHLDMSTLFQQAMPTAVRIPYLWAANKNAFGGDLVPRWPGQEGKPEAYKMHRGTQGSGYAEIADILNRLTGGDDLSPGMVDFSPELVKHLWTSIAGGLGRFVVDAFINLPSKIINKDTRLPDDIPVANKFMHDLTEKDYQGRLYEEMGNAVIAKNRGEDSALARLGKEDYRTRKELNRYRDALRGAIINHDKKAVDKAVQDIKTLSNEVHAKYRALSQ